jgi:hypothetical protein
MRHAEAIVGQIDGCAVLDSHGAGISRWAATTLAF